MIRGRHHLTFFSFILLVLCLGLLLGAQLPKDSKPDTTDWNGDFAEGWKQFDRLIEEQKHEAASALVDTMLKSARAAENNTEWTRCLVRNTALRISLHGYETAVRFLKEAPWPEDRMGMSVLNLFYAHSLTTYARRYSWEINQRERMDSEETIDLKAWTRDQIYEEAQRAYEEVWNNRDRLGELPNTEWKDFIVPNTYPEGIRPTLRDAVSYLRVDMLADTNGWQPEQLNEIYRLNLKELTDDISGEIALVDPTIHPLKKICFILSDLENWHLQREGREAALEARLERYRHLHQHFSKADDRAHLRERLINYLEPLTDIPWWSEGMAQLAEFIQPEDEPDSLYRARRIALLGQLAFPNSFGGRHCDAIIGNIESPGYSLSGMHNDNPQKRSILISHNNLEKIYFRAYAIDLMKTVEESDDYSLLPSGRKLEEFVADNPVIQKWDVELPPTPDYRMHKTFVVPPMTEPGTYLIVASARADFSKDDNSLQGMYLTISDLALISRKRSDGLEVTVLAGSSGKPVTDAEVILYRADYREGHRKYDSKRTDERGMVQFLGSEKYIRYFLVARNGDQLTYSLPQNYDRQEKPERLSATLLYTDRSIYRPGQTIHWKAVLYRNDDSDASFSTYPDTNLVVFLKDGNGQEVASNTVTSNSYGTVSGKFTIPEGRALGQWYLESSREGQTRVRVEEYKRPTFEAEMLDPDAPLRLNRPATLKGEAKYYFGLPVTEGRIEWQVYREPVFPWWWIDFFRAFMPSSQTQRIASGTESLDKDGTFSFTFTPEADENLSGDKNITYRYRVTVDVTDEGGETRSDQRSYRLGFVSVEARVSMDSAFFLEEKPIDISILRTNMDGTPRSGEGTWKIVSLEEPDKTLLPAEQPLFVPEEFREKIGFQTPGDLLRERWNHGYSPEAVLMQRKEGAIRASGSVFHDNKGKGTVSVSGLAAGAYRIVYETVDDFGEKYETSQDFIVASDSMTLRLPAMLEIEKASLKVGDTARFLVHSGMEDQFMVFEIYRDGECIQRKEMISGKDPSLVEIPITEKDRGGLGAALTLVRDNQLIHLQSSIMVSWDNKQLKVEFSTFRDRLRPGNREKWSVKVTGPTGNDIAVPAAELLAYMYDRSLDAFVPHSPPNPLNLYPYRGQSVYAQTNLSAANRLWINSRGFNRGPIPPSLHRDRLLYYNGYGIGGVGRSRAIGAGVAGGMGGGILLESESVTANDVLYFAKTSEVAGLAAPPPESARMEEDKSGTMDSGAPAIELRSEFSETAFWEPHLLTDEDGSVSFEFEVPDSVTSWNVWVHAITQDLKSGFVHKEAQSVKDLMVRPYLPRFLREGDRAEIKVVVNNASDRELDGRLNFDIIDPATDESILSEFGLTESETTGKPFTVAAGGGTNLTFPIKTPSRVGQIAFKVTAVSGDFSDGELRPIPILPGRMHLMQSRFVTLKDQDRRIIRFEDLARDDDPTRINEQMVVTLDAQLFYSILSALPYLVDYPYECTEQTLNRFVSTGILSSLYEQYPAIEKMAKEFSSRETRFEQWNASDPNRKMALEETPWLRMAEGGDEDISELIRVLDSRIAKAQQETSLSKLREMQTSSGGFPWFPGGSPSPYMTLYLLHGFSKALEFGVEVPQDMVRRAWDYTHRHYLDDIVKDMVEHDRGWEFVTFINYVLSNYPDTSWYENSFTPAERKTMLDFSYKHWKSHSPFLKGYLALTLKRMDRSRDAMLVWESVMDSAKTAEDQGTFWAPEDRAWLWYNDTIETHAFAVRTEMELIPDDPKLDGLVQWLFLNKKMNHWKSTRATAEVIYSLAHYLKETGQLGIREDATVTVGNVKTSFVFEPDKYTGKKNQVVITGDKIDPQTTSTITVEKTSKGHMFASATWHFSTERLPEEARGDYLRLTRSYFKRVHDGKEYTLQPLKEGASLQPGDEVEVHLSLESKHTMEYVHLRDPRGAGFEPSSNLSKHKWDLGISWYEEIRDSGTNFFFERLPQGEYTFKYRVRAATAGTFKISPATVQPMYAPEFAAYSAGDQLEIQ
ncbi:MAG: hypothetical protein JXR49_08895 [Acidobacteria bacterium]|nr:hypothetical protein [Acidobacteriota bacterium]